MKINTWPTKWNLFYSACCCCKWMGFFPMEFVFVWDVSWWKPYQNCLGCVMLNTGTSVVDIYRWGCESAVGQIKTAPSHDFKGFFAMYTYPRMDSFISNRKQLSLATYTAGHCIAILMGFNGTSTRLLERICRIRNPKLVWCQHGPKTRIV